jgi:invasion protein IalB
MAGDKRALGRDQKSPIDAGPRLAGSQRTTDAMHRELKSRRPRGRSMRHFYINVAGGAVSALESLRAGAAAFTVRVTVETKRLAMNGFAGRTGFGALTLVLLALLTATAGAQPSTQPTARPAAPAPRAPAAPAPKGEAAQPPGAAAQAPPTAAAQAQQVPARTEILRFDNWIVTCNEFAEGPHTRTCSALLQILQQDTNQTVFAWTIAVDNSKQMVTILQTPTGVAIPPGVELRMGKTPTRKVPFATCDPGRCVATMPMDAGLLREIVTTPTAEAVIQGSQGNTVQFTIQMKGLDKALAALSKS